MNTLERFYKSKAWESIRKVIIEQLMDLCTVREYRQKNKIDALMEHRSLYYDYS